jgi:serine/threonine-protein kinase
MSPEQIRGKRVTGQADIYSLGVTIFECLTGRVPFVGETPQELLEQHLTAAVPSARTLRPDTPFELDDLMRAMMAKDPLDRPEGMGYVSAKLRSLVSRYFPNAPARDGG